MWLLVALAACGHVHLHSTNHRVYTCHIPSKCQNVIYQVYAWYILMEKVYIRYIPGIWRAYTFHMTMYSIYLTYTDSKLSRTFRYRSRIGLDMEYTWFIPGIFHDQTVTWLVPKCPRKFGVGVCKVYTVHGHMKGIYIFYTRYTPNIYYFQLVYCMYIPCIWHLKWHIPGICWVYSTNMYGIYSFSGFRGQHT